MTKSISLEFQCALCVTVNSVDSCQIVISAKTAESLFNKIKSDSSVWFLIELMFWKKKT